MELAKIEEIQESSVVQILDKPTIPLGPSNKNLKLKVLLAGVLGLGLGIILGFIRTYFNNNDKDERRKLRRMRNFLKKKGKDVALDSRISGIVSALLLFCLPFYLGYESKNPVFFGRYSSAIMLLNTFYVITLVFSIIIFIKQRKKKV